MSRSLKRLNVTGEFTLKPFEMIEGESRLIKTDASAYCGIRGTSVSTANWSGPDSLELATERLSSNVASVNVLAKNPGVYPLKCILSLANGERITKTWHVSASKSIRYLSDTAISLVSIIPTETSATVTLSVFDFRRNIVVSIFPTVVSFPDTIGETIEYGTTTYTVTDITDDELIVNDGERSITFTRFGISGDYITVNNDGNDGSRRVYPIAPVTINAPPTAGTFGNVTITPVNSMQYIGGQYIVVSGLEFVIDIVFDTTGLTGSYLLNVEYA